MLVTSHGTEKKDVDLDLTGHLSFEFDLAYFTITLRSSTDLS